MVICLFKWTTYVRLSFTPNSLKIVSSYIKTQPLTAEFVTDTVFGHVVHHRLPCPSPPALCFAVAPLSPLPSSFCSSSSSLSLSSLSLCLSWDFALSCILLALSFCCGLHPEPFCIFILSKRLHKLPNYSLQLSSAAWVSQSAGITVVRQLLFLRGVAKTSKGYLPGDRRQRATHKCAT